MERRRKRRKTNEPDTESEAPELGSDDDDESGEEESGEEGSGFDETGSEEETAMEERLLA